MSTNDLERVREDLATLKMALAPDLPFRPTTVRFAFALGLGGVLSLLWALNPYPVGPGWRMAVPMVLQLTPMMLTAVHFAVFCKQQHCRVSAGEMKRAHMNYSPYIYAVLAAIFLILARRAGWITKDANFIEPAFLFLFGAAITAVAATEPKQQFYLGLSVPMLVGAGAGLVFHWDHLLLSSVIFATGGMALGTVMLVLLRRQAKNDAAH